MYVRRPGVAEFEGQVVTARSAVGAVPFCPACVSVCLSVRLAVPRLSCWPARPRHPSQPAPRRCHSSPLLCAVLAKSLQERTGTLQEAAAAAARRLGCAQADLPRDSSEQQCSELRSKSGSFVRSLARGAVDQELTSVLVNGSSSSDCLMRESSRKLGRGGEARGGGGAGGGGAENT